MPYDAEWRARRRRRHCRAAGRRHQGERGSFSHAAAEKMLPGCIVVPCAVSLDVFDALDKKRVDAAVIPIENSLAGSVAEHFDLLLARDVSIVGEHRLRIEHNLIAAP